VRAARPRTIADVGEFGLLARLLPSLRGGRGVVLGPGDDCAVVQTRQGRLLLTIDALVEDVHFRRDWLTPHQLGRKAFLVNASDIAAMGGVPRWCVVNLAAPSRAVAAHLVAIIRGVAAAARERGAVLVGGNLSRARQLSVTVALVGDAPARPLTRSGARPGDLLYVTGRLGEAALGVRFLGRNRRAGGPAVRRFREPPARLTAGALLARSGVASAMIDVSDGLVQDLGHLCAASRVGARVALARVPCSPRVRRADPALALAGGEDYELLCAVPARHRRRAERLAVRFGCPFTCIGECRPAGNGLQVVDREGRAVALTATGHDHFARGQGR
jgi:thiamine-monophosphate kinase